MARKHRQFQHPSLGILVAMLLVGFSGSLCQAAKPTFKEHVDRAKNQTHIELEIALPDYRLLDGGGWMVLECQSPEATPFLKQGEPALCATTYYLEIPAGATVEQISATPRPRLIPLEKPIRPVPEAVIAGSPPKPPIPDAAIYSSPAAYPEPDIEYTIGKQANTTLLVLTVYPFKYLGRSRTLRVHELTNVRITLHLPEKPPAPRPHTAVDQNLRKRLVNPDSTLMGQGGSQ